MKYIKYILGHHALKNGLAITSELQLLEKIGSNNEPKSSSQTLIQNSFIDPKIY